jgi:ribosome-binding factor A
MRWELVMKPNRQWLAGARLLCGEIGPEDGIDLRRLPRSNHTMRPGHKVRQLCKSAQRTLTLLIDGEINDSMLRNLLLVDVTPNDAGSSLLISLQYRSTGKIGQKERILEKLQAYQGWLRASIARSLKRRRVPALKFSLIPADSEDESYADS